MFSTDTSVFSAPWKNVEVVSGLVPQTNFNSCRAGGLAREVYEFTPLRTPVPFWGQATQISSCLQLSPKRYCSPKRVKSCQRVGGARPNTIDTLSVAKQTKTTYKETLCRAKSSPWYLDGIENKAISDFGGNVARLIYFQRIFMGKTPLVAQFSYLVSV